MLPPPITVATRRRCIEWFIAVGYIELLFSTAELCRVDRIDTRLCAFCQSLVQTTHGNVELDLRSSKVVDGRAALQKRELVPQRPHTSLQAIHVRPRARAR